MPSNSQSSIYQQVPKALIGRTMFDRSFSHRFTCESGYLIPAFRDEILPGDTIDLKATIFARLASQIVPFVDNAYVEFHLWFEPRRLDWSNWKKFMGERLNPGDSIDYLIPTVSMPDETGILPDTLFDYLGVRPNIPGVTIDAMYARAYNNIYNEWYRDENLQNSVYHPMDDGPDDVSQYTLLRRGKRGDYFTTGFTSPQKGPAVSIAIGGDAIPVIGNGRALGLDDGRPIDNTGDTIPPFLSYWTSTPRLAISHANGIDGGGHATSPISGGQTLNANGDTISAGTSLNKNFIGVSQHPEYSGLIADLSQTYATTINDIRTAIALQQFLEKDMIGGTRYIEMVLSHFGVVSPDARLQRPEFLGSFVSRLNQNTVAQTSQTTQGQNASPQANLAAYSTFSVQGNSITKSFTEHGILLGLLTIRSDLSYQYGLDRELTRRTRYDFFWPDLQHIGMRPTLNKEIFCDGTADDEGVFNYQMIYDEYRFKTSRISGRLRSGVKDANGNVNSVDYWTLAQDFKDSEGVIQRPAYNSDFIEENPPFKRVIAIQNEPEFIVDCDFEYYHTRPMAAYGKPGLTKL